MCDIIDAMQLLGFVQRKEDTTCALKFLTWTGITKFRRKFDGIVSLRRFYALWPDCGTLEEPKAYTRSDMEADTRYQNGSAVERFLLEFFFRMLRNDERVITSAEIGQMKQQILFENCNNLEYEQRDQMYKTLKQVLIYSGMIELHLRVLEPNKGQAENTQVKGLRWIFQTSAEKLPVGSPKSKVDEMDPANFVMSDTEYFAKRKADFVIEFRKEPPKTCM